MAYPGRGPRIFAPPPDQHRINRRIRVPQVRLIDADGSQAGIVAIEDALRRAEDQQLDLVEVAPTAQPPVCRILDYGKFKYQQHKKEAEAKKKAATTQVKELRLSYRTDIGDLERQIAKAREFLDEGDRVKFIMRFRGRELAYQDLGRAKLVRVCESLKDAAAVEGNPRMEGKMMGVILAPLRKKAPPKPAAPKVAESATAAATPTPAATAETPPAPTAES